MTYYILYFSWDILEEYEEIYDWEIRRVELIVHIPYC